MKVRTWALALLAAAVPAGVQAKSACRPQVIAELPVTMAGGRAMIAAKFGEQEARFIVDSGAFHSTLSRASAAEFGLKVRTVPGFYIQGVGGMVPAGIAESRTFSLAGIRLPKVDFAVAGSDTGTAGLIGQNILGLADVEYDLPHGMVRLITTKGCGGDANFAYWTKDRPVSVLRLEERDTVFKPHTVATVLLNGARVRAMFDTGADSSMVSTAAAKRAGVSVKGDKVTFSGMTGGLGTRQVAAWTGTFDTLDLGGEKVPHPKIDIADIGDTEMLIGVDFFLTHRIFVSNTTRLMFFTYEGGPVFGLDPKRARTADGAVIDLTDRAAAPTDAAGLSRRGAAHASNRRYAAAIADYDKAIALAPQEGHYFYQRALAKYEIDQKDAARADLDRALVLRPADVQARLWRAGLRLGDDRRDAALEDVRAADAALAPSADQRQALAGLYTELGQYDRAIASIDLWLKHHPIDSGRATAFNGRCWARALAGRELAQAMDDCNAALRLRPKTPDYLDSRALVKLRGGDVRGAIADYDAVLKAAPETSWSLYARGIAWKRAGDADKAKADRAAAVALDGDVVERGKRYGLTE